MSDPHFIRRRHVWISREGFSFLFVLVFIIVGALVRQVNLLFVLAGMLVAALLMNWRYAVVTVRKIRLTRRAPTLIHAGQSLLVQLDFVSRHRMLTCWSVNARDRIQKTFDPLLQAEFANGADARRTKQRPDHVDVQLPQISPGESASTSYRCRIEQRGTYQLGPMIVSSRFPLGLIWAFGVIRQQQTIHVAPHIGRLTNRWQRLLESRQRVGDHSAREHRPDARGDFYSIRAWRSGDARRAIHWRSSAKTGELAVRQYEMEQEGSFALLLDAWQPQAATDEQVAATEIAISFFATVIETLRQQQQSKLSIVIAARESWSRTTKIDRSTRDEIFRQLSTAVASDQPETIPLIDNVTRSLSSRQPLVVISPRTSSLQSMLATSVSPTRRIIWIDTTDPSIDTLFKLPR
jgi:hypothetical protein